MEEERKKKIDAADAFHFAKHHAPQMNRRNVEIDAA